MTNLVLGVVGSGFVGSSVINGFNTKTVDQVVVDPAKTSVTIKQLAEAKPSITFVCVPTPNNEHGEVDLNIVSEVLDELARYDYRGIVVLKSTITPNGLRAFTQAYRLRIVYNPEFLTANNAWQDFINPKMQILGGMWDDCIEVERAYVEHSNVKTVPTFKTDIASASLIKYSINAWLATKVVFMNELYDLHRKCDTDTTWDQFVEMITTDPRIGDSHMQVPGPDYKKGFGGLCFPKDTEALINFAMSEACELSVLRQAVERNKEIRD